VTHEFGRVAWRSESDIVEINDNSIGVPQPGAVKFDVGHRDGHNDADDLDCAERGRH
jgi:hypothetical protein